MSTYEPILSLMRSMAMGAGKIMLEQFDGHYRIYSKSDGSRVTDVDLAVSDYIQRRVEKECPEVHLYSEESPPHDLRTDRPCLIVDELDGTSAFIDSRRGYSFQAAYYEPGVGLVVGLVYHPWNQGEMIFAIQGEGAYLSAAGRISRLQYPQFTDPLLFAHPYRYQGMKYHRLFDYLEVKPRQVVFTDATRTIQMALGQLDVNIMLRQRIPEWDWAGEKVVLQELGFHHSFLDGGEVIFGALPPSDNRGYLICRKEIAGEMLEKINAFLDQN